MHEKAKGIRKPDSHRIFALLKIKTKIGSQEKLSIFTQNDKITGEFEVLKC